MSAPAFTSVSTRRQFGEPQPVYIPPAAAPPAGSSPSRRIEWPPSVRLYVQRCFAEEHRIPNVSSEEMQAKLKQVINHAAETNQLQTLDWDFLALPQQMIQRERMTQQPSIWQGQVANLNIHEIPPTDIATSKKRKSMEMEDGNNINSSAPPPWRKPNPNSVFEDRITYPDPVLSKRAEKRQRKSQEDQNNFKNISKSTAELEKRRQRFEKINPGLSSPAFTASRDDTPTSEASIGPVVGTCQELEKRYLRLTAAPKPEAVRPLPVLRQTLDLLKKKWKSESNYGYICDQFKSLRQDLTVQHVKNEFTVHVYECHARIALEKGDMGEYNQCQAQLRALYKQNLGGKPSEFLAYRILYFIYTCNQTDMNNVLADVRVSASREHSVRHALQTRSALALGNYHRFFKLYMETPNMGAYLMDMFIDRERVAALASICRAYKQDVGLGFLTEELAFETDEACCAFICEHGGGELFEKRGDEIRFTTAKAGPTFESAKRAAFRSVDIKGQI